MGQAGTTVAAQWSDGAGLCGIDRSQVGIVDPLGVATEAGDSRRAPGAPAGTARGSGIHVNGGSALIQGYSGLCGEKLRRSEKGRYGNSGL